MAVWSETCDWLARTHRSCSKSAGGTQSYTCLGPATYESHRGSKPIATTYQLKHEMRIEDYRVASVIS